jgi:branched-chain amino acid transport system ATP-binding protein
VGGEAFAGNESVALQIEDIQVHYGLSHVLHGASMDVPEQQVTVIVGRNGVGKTTLVNTIMGLVPATQGRVLVGETDLLPLPAHRRRSMGLALVPQGRRVFGSLTVSEHVNLLGRAAPGSRFSPERVLELFPRLQDRINTLGRQLSGGEQAMLSIARGLIANPSIMLMDEPTEGLAPLIVQHVGDMILAMRDAGVTILLVEQNLNFALSVADCVAVMERGCISHVFGRDEIKDVEALSDLIMQGAGALSRTAGGTGEV